MGRISLSADLRSRARVSTSSLSSSASGGGPPPSGGGGFTDPSDIVGLWAWYDASDAATITDTAGAVDQWDDKSGNGRHVTASTTARPTTGTRTLNGVNVLDFNGSANRMTDAANALAGGPAAIFAVVAADTGSGNMFAFELGQNGGFPSLYLWRNNGVGELYAGYHDGAGYRDYGAPLTHDSQPDIWAGVIGASDVDVRFNRTEDLTARTGYPRTDSYTINIGTARDGSGQFDGVIAELIVYDAAITPADVANIETYLHDKWFGAPTGGTITDDAVYRYHTFATAGAAEFDPNSFDGLTADVLQVAGGAGGGANIGGGGGAGDVVVTTATTLTGVQSISVGAAGAGGAGDNDGGDGGNTTFGALSPAIGGGGGGGRAGITGSAGGSGGGSGNRSGVYTRTGGASTANGLGNAGGDTLEETGFPGGGGGGAGGAGENGGTGGAGLDIAGDGGAGYDASAFDQGTLAGGGGGGAYSAGGGTAGAGTDGGGNGNNSNSGSPATTRGSGGGGGGFGFDGGAGEDGVAVVKYTKSQIGSVLTGNTSWVADSGDVLETSSTTIARDVPASSAADDLVVAFLFHREGADTITAPAGFTRVAQQANPGSSGFAQWASVWVKKDDGTMASTTLTFTNSGANRMGLLVAVLRNSDGTTPALVASTGDSGAGAASPGTETWDPVTATKTTDSLWVGFATCSLSAVSGDTSYTASDGTQETTVSQPQNRIIVTQETTGPATISGRSASHATTDHDWASLAMIFS